ncbi:glutathione transferase GstA [Sphingorhabdus sp. Alg231-15]|uniref:glutathione transferase GstA n=1 Tax=Sphingorhabdus sp. Alg231-15 TaxID=1922222 RepID=UPI000D55DD5A
MKLYYKPGACSLASHIILEELKASFTLEMVDTIEQRTETGADYREINPLGYVPALVLEDGTILIEGPAVLQHIGDQFPDSGLTAPFASIERAEQNGMLNFLSSELHNAFGPFFTQTPPGSNEKKAHLNRISRLVQFLENNLRDGREYLSGSSFTVSDAFAFVVLSWSTYVDLSLSDFPLITAYMERLSKRPSVISAMTSEGLLD